MQVWELSSEISHRGDGGLKLDGRSAVKIVVDGIEKPLADVIYKPTENTLYLVDEKDGDKCLKSLSVLKEYTMRTEQTQYSIYRSRNNGKFWSLISYGMNLDLEGAQSFFEKEQKRHPSDWLRIVQEKSSVVYEYFGNPKKNPPTNTSVIV